MSAPLSWGHTALHPRSAPPSQMGSQPLPIWGCRSGEQGFQHAPEWSGQFTETEAGRARSWLCRLGIRLRLKTTFPEATEIESAGPLQSNLALLPERVAGVIAGLGVPPHASAPCPLCGPAALSLC